MDKKQTIEKAKELKEYSGEDRLILATELMQELEKENKGLLNFMTGMQKMDELTQGFKPGNLIALGGFPGEGKSTFARTLTKRFLDNKIHCLWFQFEESEFEFLKHFGDNIPEFFIPKTIKEKSIDWIEEKIIESVVSKNIQEEKRPKIIFIDNLNAIKNTALSRQEKAGLNEVSLYEVISQRIKNLAVDYELSVFLMVNSNRSEANGRQSILDDSSFYGSQQIAHIADSCWSIWRRKEKAKSWDKPAQFYDEAMLNISKNRGYNRKCGIIKLKFENGEFSEIEELNNTYE